MVTINRTYRAIAKYLLIMKIFLDYPKRQLTPREVSIMTKISYTTVFRHIKDLENLGVINVTKLGAYNSCRLNEKSRVVPFFKDLLKEEFSSHIHHILSLRRFVHYIRRIHSVDKIIVFGSVAKGTAKIKSDVDVAVIGNISEKEKNRINNVINKILEDDRVTIVVVYMKSSELEKCTQFSKELKEGKILYERYKRI